MLANPDKRGDRLDAAPAGQPARASLVNLDTWRRMTPDQHCMLVSATAFVVLLLLQLLGLGRWGVAALLVSLAAICGCICKGRVMRFVRHAAERRWWHAASDGAVALVAGVAAGRILFGAASMLIPG